MDVEPKINNRKIDMKSVFKIFKSLNLLCSKCCENILQDYVSNIKTVIKDNGYKGKCTDTTYW